MEADVRWKQRIENYSTALAQLRSAIQETANPSNLEKEGTIQRFEFTHELAWKVMKDYLQYEGIVGITGSRSATREAFNKGLISNGQVWMDMIESRNKTVHTYLEDILTTEYDTIVNTYFPLFEQFYQKMKSLL
jgi:nucleotidyltransferase substrate binding protein (TIGR01987 family)